MPTNKRISKIFLTNKISATLIIPIDMAKNHRLDGDSYVSIEDRPEGILIRKLDV